jgi:hypothetical protein
MPYDIANLDGIPFVWLGTTDFLADELDEYTVFVLASLHSDLVPTIPPTQ